MRVFVACEFSGRVRDAFIDAGHDAWSCDIVPSEADGPHILGDVRDHLAGNWDLMIAFPPCTYLCRSGARWWPERIREQAGALDLVCDLIGAPIDRIALENPVGVISRVIRKPDQIVQPWWFGDGYSKQTCLWLKNLPSLCPTKVVRPDLRYIHNLPPSPGRSRLRSLTPQGLATAMASQWCDPSPR